MDTMADIIVGASVILATQMLFSIPAALSSDEESSSDDEDLSALALLNGRKWKKPQRIEQYVEQILPMYNKQMFQQNFRITVDAYEKLLEVAGPLLRRQGTTGRTTINPEKQLLSVIWIIATPDSYRSVAERFDISKSTLSKCVMRVVRVLNQLAPTIIKWPSIPEMLTITRHFQSIARMPQCIGAVDGTYVVIKAPKEDPQSYITRKCDYAFTLQAIAEPSLMFRDAFIGYPGSVSDTRIFRNSDVYHAATANTARLFPDGKFILGDKAYPVLDWCIPPYINRGNLTRAQVHFNTVHAKTRQVIERAFALLFGRFRRLKFLDMNCTQAIPATVLAACVMHNICLEFPDLNMNEYIQEGLEHLAHHNDNHENDEGRRMEGRRRRDVLCQALFEAYNNVDNQL